VESVLHQLRHDGHDVVRNGYLLGRLLTTAVGDAVVEVPRIRARDGESVNFASSMIPRYLRRSLSISAWAAYAYLKGISERDVSSVLEVMLGEGAKKLTPAVLSELKKSWTKEFNEWNQRELSKVRFTYLFADGIY
jgi:transposase-like protein